MNNTLAAFSFILVSSFVVHDQNFDSGLRGPASSKNSVPKVSFEQRTGVLVWDVGTKPGFVDSGDDITDLSEMCGIADSSIIPDPIQILADKSLDTNQLNKVVDVILNKVGLVAGNFHSSPVLASLGKDDQPIFILFPEKHLNSPVSSQLGNLHAGLAVDMLNMTARLEEQNIKVLNTMEGSQGSWRKQYNLDPKNLSDRRNQANKLMETKWISGGQMIGEVYGDRVTTQYHDDNDLTIKYTLSLQAYVMSFESDRSNTNAFWARAKGNLLSKFPERSEAVKFDDYEKYFKDLVSLRTENIREINSELCEERSREMARYTYALAKKEGARVVYISFGALHAHGVIQQLQSYSATTLVLSPNL